MVLKPSPKIVAWGLAGITLAALMFAFQKHRSEQRALEALAAAEVRLTELAVALSNAKTSVRSYELRAKGAEGIVAAANKIKRRTITEPENPEAPAKEMIKVKKKPAIDEIDPDILADLVAIAEAEEIKDEAIEKLSKANDVLEGKLRRARRSKPWFALGGAAITATIFILAK